VPHQQQGPALSCWAQRSISLPLATDLRGVSPERSEWAQGDTGWLFKRSSTIRPIEPCL